MFLEIWPNSCLVSVVSLGMLMQRYVTYLTKAFLCFVLIMKYFRNRFVGKFVSKIFPIKTTSNYSNSAVTKLYANYWLYPSWGQLPLHIRQYLSKEYSLTQTFFFSDIL